MTYLLYDGTFEGFISAVFDVYELKLKNAQIIKKSEDIPDLFANKIQSFYTEEKYNRVKTKLEAYLGKNGFHKLWKAILSEEKNIEEVLLGVIKYSLQSKKDTLKDYGNIYVIKLNEILKKIGRETHRMTAFVRFKLAKDGIYYATIEPDFNVLPLISNHFKRRFADQKWLIFDMQRSYGIFYDLETVTPIQLSNENQQSLHTIDIEWDEIESEFQQLWKDYFQSVNIKSRKNTKLHVQSLPKRYWKYLIEKS